MPDHRRHQHQSGGGGSGNCHMLIFNCIDAVDAAVAVVHDVVVGVGVGVDVDVNAKIDSPTKTFCSGQSDTVNVLSGKPWCKLVN